MEPRNALNPDLARVLKLFHLDRIWERGEGIWLYDSSGRRFLDCYSQYGAVPLGHNAPSIVEAVRKALENRRPAMVQPYRAPYAVSLARELVRVTPENLNRCFFTTSGAETVEAAVKLVRARTGRRIIVSCEGGFHGTTLATMAASGRPVNEELYGPMCPNFFQVPYGNATALERFLQNHGSDVAAVLLEPIQGESGVHVPEDGYLSSVRELCTQYGVAMVLDEIQTGLGRTGRLFAFEEEGISPDLLLLSKAIGGGLFPLGVCIVAEEFWDSRFALNHSSTFANNNIACCVGLKVLESLTKEGFCNSVRSKGVKLLSGLRELAERYPKVVAEVRGRGLLTAIELHPPAPDAGILLSYLFHQNLYSYGFATTLAERESVLVLPTLRNNNVIRITPPLIIEEDQLQKALAGLDAVLDLFERGAIDEIARAVGDLKHRSSRRFDNHRTSSSSVMLPRKTITPIKDASFAFLLHPTARKDIINSDPKLAGLSKEELNRYIHYLSDLPPGVVFEVPKIYSAEGTTARGWLIGMGILPEEMAVRGRQYMVKEIKRCVDLSRTLGAQILGLGAFTTIYSHCGKDVVGRGISITTGNILTADMAFRAIKRVMERRGQAFTDSSIGVVGAMGSVASLCSKLLARENPGSMMLVGNPKASTGSMVRTANYLKEIGHCPVTITSNLQMLSHCNVVLSATSSYQPILDDIPFGYGTIICDVARPHDAGEKLRNRPDITVIDGGLVSLPDPGICFGAGNIQGSPPGVQLACLSETILLAMAGISEDIGVGRNFDLSQVDRMRVLADKHGFVLAEPPLDSLDINSEGSLNKVPVGGCP